MKFDFCNIVESHFGRLQPSAYHNLMYNIIHGRELTEKEAEFKQKYIVKIFILFLKKYNAYYHYTNALDFRRYNFLRLCTPIDYFMMAFTWSEHPCKNIDWCRLDSYWRALCSQLTYSHD